MLEGALCPNCTAPVSNTVVRANAPICTKCGVTITIIDGKLGFIRPYRIHDLGITRERAENDLALYRKHLMRYRGMQGDCNQKLDWSVEQFAEYHKMLPQPPELLELEDVPSFLAGLGMGLVLLLGMGGIILVVLVIIAIGLDISGTQTIVNGSGIHSIYPNHFVEQVQGIATLLFWGPSVICVLYRSFIHFRAKTANGNRPAENARRKKTYERDMATTLRAAKSAKEIEDYKLEDQIRELEGHIRTVKIEETEVLRFLETLKN